MLLKTFEEVSVGLWSFLFCVWAIILIAWCYNWIKYRGNPGIGLHIIIGITLFFNMLMSLLWCFWWRYYDYLLKKGEWFDDVFGLADVVSIGLFRSLLILIARGWCITRDNLSFNFKCGLTCSMGIFLAVQIYAAYVVGNWLYLLFFLVVCMYILMLCYIFYCLFENIRELEISSHNTPGKLRMFRQFRVVIIAYLVAEMFSIFFNEDDFILFTRACLDALCMAGICWAFRLQEVNSVYYQPLFEGEMSPLPASASIVGPVDRASSEMSDLPLDDDSEDGRRDTETIHPHSSAVIQV